MAYLIFTTTLLLILMFILQLSLADTTQQVKDNTSVAVQNGRPSAVDEKFMLNDLTTPEEARSSKIGGRKMIKKAAKVSNATESVTNSCSNAAEKRKLKIDCRMNNRRSHGRRHGRRTKRNSFVALNADYRPPRSHPPKNN